MTMYLDDEASSGGTWRTSTSGRRRVAGRSPSRRRVLGRPRQLPGLAPAPKWNTAANRPAGNALPFGVSYETLRNPGPRVSVEFDGQDSTQVVRTPGPTTGGGYGARATTCSASSTPVSGGDTVSFWNWHFIEEGWDYGFVEALVGR